MVFGYSVPIVIGIKRGKLERVCPSTQAIMHELHKPGEGLENGVQEQNSDRMQ